MLWINPPPLTRDFAICLSCRSKYQQAISSEIDILVNACELGSLGVIHHKEQSSYIFAYKRGVLSMAHASGFPAAMERPKVIGIAD
ncbi:hypothetical protein RHMOL_Rhmol10G0023900 [Rhododendron molle]|uniref:Uncharacterized protein n=1 Tax=Rhododendron molle TaxID=49168 RepID=A0ACC0LXW6_RHOML|nr:hypothetical protein RHMOL_Rhmol10G0023900 [Rhododendron molle]